MTRCDQGIRQGFVKIGDTTSKGKCGTDQYDVHGESGFVGTRDRSGLNALVDEIAIAIR